MDGKVRFGLITARGWTVIVPSDKHIVDIDVIAKIRDGAFQAMNLGFTRIIFDFSNVEFADEKLLGALEEVLVRSKAEGGALRLTGFHRGVLGGYEVGDLKEKYEVFETREAALEAA